MDESNMETNEAYPPPPVPPPLPIINLPVSSFSVPRDEISVQRSTSGSMDMKRIQGTKQHQKEMQFRLVGAIEQRNLSRIRHLIDDDVNIDCIILYAKTPLLHAVEQGYDDVAEFLIDSGANLEKAETIAWQRRPLHMAVQKNSQVMVEKLLSKGAKVDAQDGCGMTALHHACHLGYKDIVEVLLQHKTCIFTGDYVERDALHRALEGGHLDIAEMLLRRKMFVDGADRFGWTPLFQCVMANDIKGTRFLLEWGADINYRDEKGDTPLHVACDRLSRANMRTMLSTSVDFYRRMRRIPTSDVQRLLQGESKANFEMVELLVNTGADVNAANDFLSRPVHMTREPVVLRYLILCGAYIDYDMVLLSHLFGGDDDPPSWLEEEFVMQTTLQRLCRGAIRWHLRRTRNIKSATKKLPLPNRLINFLNLEEMTFGEVNVD